MLTAVLPAHQDGLRLRVWLDNLDAKDFALADCVNRLASLGVEAIPSIFRVELDRLDVLNVTVEQLDYELHDQLPRVGSNRCSKFSIEFKCRISRGMRPLP
jgi:hypothetical protein